MLKLVVHAQAGDHISDTAKAMIDLAVKLPNVMVTCLFNDTYLTATDCTLFTDIITDYDRQRRSLRKQNG